MTPKPHEILNDNRLPLTVRHSDHELKQVWRDETHAVYKHFGASGRFIGWEAIKIKRLKPRSVFGRDYPAMESYPAASDFGRFALSVGAQYDMDDAIQKAKAL